MGWVSNERAMLISRQIRAGMCRWEHNVETQSQVPSIIQNQNKREWLHLNIFLYLEVLKLYNFNTYLTCSCFLCLAFLQFCIKSMAGAITRNRNPEYGTVKYEGKVFSVLKIFHENIGHEKVSYR